MWGQRLNWMALVGPFQLGVLCDSLQKGFPGSFHSHHPLQTSLCEATDLPSICCYADKPQRTPTKESCHSHRHTLIHSCSEFAFFPKAFFKIFLSKSFIILLTTGVPHSSASWLRSLSRVCRVGARRAEALGSTREASFFPHPFLIPLLLPPLPFCFWHCCTVQGVW